jgi:hypothetical protein
LITHTDSQDEKEGDLGRKGELKVEKGGIRCVLSYAQ